MRKLPKTSPGASVVTLSFWRGPIGAHKPSPPVQCARPASRLLSRGCPRKPARPAQLPRRAHVRRRPRAAAGALHRRAERRRGPSAVALHERAAALGKRSRAGDHAATRELEELVAELSLDDAQVLMRSLSRWFQLVNLAEDNERVRRLRRRERGARRHAARRLAARRDPAPRRARHHRRRAARACSRGAELRLVMTAHPTEARRRTTVEKLARIFARAARPRRAPARARRRGGGAARDRRHDPGAVGLRRGARRLPHPARRGPRRARLLRLDAAPRRARALPRARGRGRGGLPGRGDPRCRRC